MRDIDVSKIKKGDIVTFRSGAKSTVEHDIIELRRYKKEPYYKIFGFTAHHKKDGTVVNPRGIKTDWDIVAIGRGGNDE